MSLTFKDDVSCDTITWYGAVRCYQVFGVNDTDVSKGRGTAADWPAVDSPTSPNFEMLLVLLL